LSVDVVSNEMCLILPAFEEGNGCQMSVLAALKVYWLRSSHMYRVLDIFESA